MENINNLSETSKLEALLNSQIEFNKPPKTQGDVIYLDYASTTPTDPRVIFAMQAALEQHYGNPASRSHSYGWLAEDLVEESRQKVAALINASAKEIVWTSGATESDNLAIKGAAKFYQGRGKHIITCKTEHKAVLDTCRQLEVEGFEVTYLSPDDDGILSLDAIKAAVRDDTILISIMHVNNELGVIQDIESIGEFTRDRGILFHVDAAQSAGKVEIDVKKAKVDLLSLSAHKVYGPKGVGALYVSRKPRVRLEAIIHGGGHERGMRSGTLATHQIVGMGVACMLAKEGLAKESAILAKYKQKLLDSLSTIEASKINGSVKQSIPGILNISFNYVEGESLMMALKHLAVSSGSACTSASLEPSYVLRAIGLSDELAHSSLRISFGRFTTEEEIDKTIESIFAAVAKLRDLSPLWEMYKEGVDLSQIEWNEH